MDAVLPCSLRTAHSPDEAARQPLASLPSSVGVAIEAARGEPQDTSASDTRATQPYVGHKNIQFNSQGAPPTLIVRSLASVAGKSLPPVFSPPVFRWRRDYAPDASRSP